MGQAKPLPTSATRLAPLETSGLRVGVRVGAGVALVFPECGSSDFQPVVVWHSSHACCAE
jgi:hypothetical protein